AGGELRRLAVRGLGSACQRWKKAASGLPGRAANPSPFQNFPRTSILKADRGKISVETRGFGSAFPAEHRQIVLSSASPFRCYSECHIGVLVTFGLHGTPAAIAGVIFSVLCILMKLYQTVYSATM